MENWIKVLLESTLLDLLYITEIKLIFITTHRATPVRSI